MIWLTLGFLALLFSFIMSWKREGITQAILSLISMVSIFFAFFYNFIFAMVERQQTKITSIFRGSTIRKKISFRKGEIS